ncbi:MAG: hypothetical protein HY292_07835 [Planctomycetes bacterium]|nr:hypothetical protein [Planctomycetota bacterium]
MRPRSERSRVARIVASVDIVVAAATACSSHSVDDAARQYAVATRQLRDDVDRLRKSLEAMKANWDVEEESGQAQVHWDRLLASVKTEAEAEQSFGRGELIEAKALASIRDETSKVLSSDATVRSILLRVEQVRTQTQRVEPRLRSARAHVAAVRAKFDSASELGEEDRQLLQAKVDLAGRRLNELQSLAGTGLKWLMSPIDGQRGATAIETALKDLFALEATMREVEEEIDAKSAAMTSQEDGAAPR